MMAVMQRDGRVKGISKKRKSKVANIARLSKMEVAIAGKTGCGVCGEPLSGSIRLAPPSRFFDLHLVALALLIAPNPYKSLDALSLELVLSRTELIIHVSLETLGGSPNAYFAQFSI